MAIKIMITVLRRDIMPRLASLKGRFPIIIIVALSAMCFHVPLAFAAQGPDEPIALEIFPFARASGNLLSETDPIARAGGLSSVEAVAQSALPALLAATLVRYQHVRVVVGLSSQTISFRDLTPLDQTSKEPSVQADFFVKGFISLRDDNISINATIGRRTAATTQRLKPVVGPIDRLYDSAEELALMIANEIARQSRIRFTQRTIVVACMRENTSADAVKLEPEIQRGVLALIDNLTRSGRGKPIKWAVSQQKDCPPLTDMRKLATVERADAVVAVSPQLSKEGGRVFSNGAVKSSIYIRAEDRWIPMPDIAFTSAPLIEDYRELDRQLRTLVSAVLTPTGDWRTSDIPETEGSAAKYLEIAKQFSASQDKPSNRTAALEEYFFTMAVSRSAELSNLEASDAGFRLARIRLKQGRLDDAAALLEKSAAVNPDSFEIKLSRAELSLRRGQYDLSKEQFRDIMGRFPSRKEGYEGLAELLIVRDDDDGAAQTYRDLIRIMPEASTAAYRGLAKLSLAKGDKGDFLTEENWLEAASFLETGIGSLADENQRIELKQELSRLYADAGRAFYLNKKYETSKIFLGKSILAAPSVKAYFNRGGLYYITEGEKSDNALFDYSQAVILAERADAPAITPEYIGSRLAVLEILTLQEKYEAAAAYAEQTVGLFTSNAETLSLEPVVRLIGLAAKIAGNIPDFAKDVKKLESVTASRDPTPDYSFGSYYWKFGAIDDFVNGKPDIPENLKCLFRQLSRAVQAPTPDALFQLNKCGFSREGSGTGR